MTGLPGRLVVFDRHGQLNRDVAVAGASPALLGLAFHPSGKLLVIDFGAAKVLDVNPNTGASSVFMTVPSPPGAAGLNALTFDKHGNVYVSDSFQGTIWKTGSGGGVATAWVSDPLLLPNGVPPFGANGLAFNNAGDALFVANTSTDLIVKIPVLANGSAGTPKAFSYSVNGADGLIIDEHDNLWICANQADEIVVLDKTGKAISKLGDFNGISSGGRPKGLLFPASLVRVGDWIYVTNLSLDLRSIGGPQTIDSQWAAKVTRQTISRLKAKIRGFDD